MTSKKLIIIPARKGSKGLPNKNKLILGQIPLIQWSINHAIECFAEYNLLVSTDDLEIIDLCIKLNVQFQCRSDELSSDKAMMIDVLLNSLVFFEKKNNCKIDEIILLQPTFPFRTYEDSINLKKIINSQEFENIVSVIKVNDSHPSRMYKINNNLLCPIDEKFNNLNRQDLPPVYLRNGAYYCFKSTLIRTGKLYGNMLIPFIMETENKINIDERIDFQLAKIIYDEVYKS